MRTAFGGVLLIGGAISVIGLIAIAGLSLSVKGGRARALNPRCCQAGTGLLARNRRHMEACTE